MAETLVKRKILSGSREFKLFWDNSGPFKYALTSREYPPVMLKEEEWLFSSDMRLLLKELMQYDQQKMKFVRAPFARENKSVLRPEDLSEWKIVNFPEEWNGAVCDIFVPQGHITLAVLEKIEVDPLAVNAEMIETAFFSCLEREISKLGYELFKPVKGAKRAAVQSYLKEWEKDEKEAGLI